MKVHVWGINYSPEVTGIGPYNAALCEFLAGRGHAVRMITSFCYYPAWRKLPSEAKLLYRTDSEEGVTVHRCWHYVPKRVTTLRRVWHELSFVLSSFLRQLALPRPDLLVVVSPPLLLGVAAWVLCRIKQSKFVFHVQDLQPDAAAGLGMVKSDSWFLRALRKLELAAYAKATRVSAITPGMLRKIEARGIGREKLILFPNGVELPDFWRLPARGQFRKATGIPEDAFLVVYSGNLGRKQGLDQLLRAAAQVRNPKVRVVICGDGAEREVLQQQAAPLRNVTLLPLLPEPRYRELLLDADLCVIPQRPQSESCFFPSKLLTTLAFSSPVLAMTERGTELDRAVAEGAFGVSLPPGEPREIAATLDELSAQPELLKQWGRAGFKFVKRFEQAAVLEEFVRTLTSIHLGTRQAPHPAATKKPDARITRPVFEIVSK